MPFKIQCMLLIIGNLFFKIFKELKKWFTKRIMFTKNYK